MPTTNLTIPMIVKSQYPVLTFFMLAAVAAAIVYVLFLMIRHERSVRRAKKNGPHDGHR